MVTIILRTLILLATIVLVVRILRVFYLKRQRQSHPPGPNQLNTVKDPVCGMYMDPRLALRTNHDGVAFYFCSDACRQKFVLAGYRNPENDFQNSRAVKNGRI